MPQRNASCLSSSKAFAVIAIIGMEASSLFQATDDILDSKEILRSGHILLVEDNELNQEIAVAILEEAGLTAEVAENGQIAVEMLKSSQPGYLSVFLRHF